EMLEKEQPVDSAAWQRQFAGSKNTGILREIITVLQPAIENADNVPLLVCGDFNSGSHLDWVAATRQLNRGYVMPFPATRLMEEAGFADSFREIHPDP